MEILIVEIEMKQITPTTLYVKAAGRLDIDSAVEYGTKIKDFVEDKNISNLTLDFSEITFISSFGLKVILEIYQTMNGNKNIVITRASEQIKNSFRMVGFDRFVNLEL